MPELNQAVVHVAPSGALYPAIVLKVDATDNTVFLRYFALSLCTWLTGWRSIDSLQVN